VFSETRYALNGDLRVAYRASREGPRDIVFVPNWFTNCEVSPELPSAQGWVEAMTSLGRLIFFDQPGTGASAWRARHLATPGGGSPWSAGGVGRGGTSVNTHPRPSDRDAPVGPRRGGDGQANTVDPARDGPPRPSHQSQLDPLGYKRWEGISVIALSTWPGGDQRPR
jgi:hypothetical protein